MTTRMSSAPVSKLSLEAFDTNLCLICSVEFMKDGSINTEKINFVEVVHKGNIVKREVVSISLALNTVLRLLPEKRIDEDHGLNFGCCSVCTNLLSQLYELHKKLDTLRGFDSIISKILDINESSSLNRNPELDKVQAKGRADPSSGLVNNPSLLACDEVFASSDSECSTDTSDPGVTALNTVLESTLQEEVEESILILAPESAAKEQCPNCCVDLQLKSRIGFTQVECSSEARRGVDAVLYKPSSVSQPTPLSEKILVSDMLNNFLKLPPQNPWTRELRMCSDCAPMLLRVHIALQRFENARKPESRLKLMYQDMRSFMLRRTAPAKSPPRSRKTLTPSNNKIHVSSTISGLTVKKRFAAAGVTKKVLDTASATECSQMEDEDSSSGIMDVDKSEGTQGNESDSSWSMSSKESFVSRRPMTTRSRSTTTLNANLQKKSTAPAQVLMETKTKQRICVNKLPVKRVRMRRHPREYFTAGRKVDEEKSLKPPKKKGRPPRKVSDGNDSTNEDPKPQRRKASNKVRSMEQIEATRIRGRADYWRKLGNAEKITHKPCPHCGIVLKNKSKFALEIHIRLQHKHIGYYSCGICGKPYDGIYPKEEHEKTHLSNAERIELKEAEPAPTPKFLCPECGKGFKFQSELHKHSKTHASVDTRLLHCPETNCDFTCLCKSAMSTHIERIHNPSAIPKYECKVCSQGFQSFNELKNHEMTICDAGNRPFTCDQGTCQSRFKLKHGLLHHLHTAHPFTVEEAREKLYPGLPCPDWVAGKYTRQRKSKSGRVRTANN